MFLAIVQVDNYLYTGSLGRLHEFEARMKSLFVFGECRLDEFEFYDCKNFSDENIVILSKEGLSRLRGNDLYSDRAAMSHDEATEAEIFVQS